MQAFQTPIWVTNAEEDNLFISALTLGSGDMNLPTFVSSKQRCIQFVETKKGSLNDLIANYLWKVGSVLDVSGDILLQ